jgi:hypothetical protein
MKILKFYEIFERVVSLLFHAMGCLTGNNTVVTGKQLVVSRLG